MDKLRTDLAMEARALWQSSPQFSTNVRGIVQEERSRDGIGVTVVEVTTPEGAQALGKPEGRYVTLSLDGVQRRESDAFPRTVRAIAEELGPFLKGMDGPVLVAGLGNRFITPDALGPETHRNVLVIP